MGMQGCTPRAGEPDHPLPQWESDQEQFCWRQQGKMGIAGMSEEWDLIFLFWNVLLLQWSNNNIINSCIHFFSKFYKKKLYWVSVARCQQQGGYRGGVCEKRWGLPHAAYDWLQLAPTDTAEPLSQRSGISGKMFKKGQKMQEGGREDWETAEGTPSSEKKEGKEVLHALKQRFLCSPWREKLSVSEGNAAHGEPMQVQGKSVRKRKKLQGGTVMDWPTVTPHSPSLSAWWEQKVEESGVKD